MPQLDTDIVSLSGPHSGHTPAPASGSTLFLGEAHDKRPWFLVRESGVCGVRIGERGHTEFYSLTNIVAQWQRLSRLPIDESLPRYASEALIHLDQWVPGAGEPWQLIRGKGLALYIWHPKSGDKAWILIDPQTRRTSLHNDPLCETPSGSVHRHARLAPCIFI